MLNKIGAQDIQILVWNHYNDIPLYWRTELCFLWKNKSKRTSSIITTRQRVMFVMFPMKIWMWRESHVVQCITINVAAVILRSGDGEKWCSIRKCETCNHAFSHNGNSNFRNSERDPIMSTLVPLLGSKDTTQKLSRSKIDQNFSQHLNVTLFLRSFLWCPSPSWSSEQQHSLTQSKHRSVVFDLMVYFSTAGRLRRELSRIRLSHRLTKVRYSLHCALLGLSTKDGTPHAAHQPMVCNTAHPVSLRHHKNT